MKYTKNERLEIGKKIYDGELNREQASILYDISADTACGYYRLNKAWVELKEKGLVEE